MSYDYRPRACVVAKCGKTHYAKGKCRQHYFLSRQPRAEYYANYREKNREALRARARKHYAENREKILAKNRAKWVPRSQRSSFHYEQALVRVPLAGWGVRV